MDSFLKVDLKFYPLSGVAEESRPHGSVKKKLTAKAPITPSYFLREN
jgi:hypothetical protein